LSYAGASMKHNICRQNGNVNRAKGKKSTFFVRRADFLAIFPLMMYIIPSPQQPDQIISGEQR